MKIQVAKQKEASFGSKAEKGAVAPVIEYETINIFEKFKEYIYEVEKDYYPVRKIVMSSELYHIMKQSDEYQQIMHYDKTGEVMEQTIYGAKIGHEEFGDQSLTDFLIYTDRKVVHSEMLEKTFLEDVDDKQIVDNLDVEELVHETNKRIDERKD